MSGQSIRESWLPMVVIAMGQMLLSFNVFAIPVSISGIVESLGVPPTTVGTAIIVYSLGVSGFILLGAKLGRRFGARRVFQVMILAFGGAMAMMALSPSAEVMLLAQGLAGLACAAVVPTLVVLIARHYHGSQQAEALGWLGSAGAIASVIAFLVGGALATLATWRVTYALFALHAVAILPLSIRLLPDPPSRDVKVDVMGAFLSATAVIVFTLGFSHFRDWGVLMASPAAPFDLVGVSPALLMVVAGAVLGFAFLSWTRRRIAAGKSPLLSLGVINSAGEWAAAAAVFCLGVTESALIFAIPLYTQIVQGRTSLTTALVMMPFMLAVFFTAIFIVRLFRRFTPRAIASTAFVLIFAGTLWLAVVVRNDWQVLPVVIGLILVGLGQGTLMTLLFNVLISAAPKELAGDVGSARGVIQNLAAAIGTALMAALLVGILDQQIHQALTQNPVISEEFKRTELVDRLNLDSVNFISNDHLKQRLQATSATSDLIDEAIRINGLARLNALKMGFLTLSGMALFAILPCCWLPDYKPGEICPAEAD